MATDHILGVIGSQPGIDRDGTEYDRNCYISGQWCRFYRGKPRKIGGYELTDVGTSEIVRNMFVVSRQNTIDAYLGRPSSLNVVNIDLNGAAGAEFSRTPANFVANPNNQWTFDLYTELSGSVPVLLANNPIHTLIATNTVTVDFPTAGLQNNDYVTIAGATATGGLTVDQLNITAPITIVNAAQFSYVVGGAPAGATAAGGGAAVTVNRGPAPFLLGLDPLRTVNGSAVVVVTVASTSGLRTGQFVKIAGAVLTGGIAAVNLNITAAITVIDGTHFSYMATAAAAADAVGGGTIVTYAIQAPVTFIVAVAPTNLTDINNNVEALIYWGDIMAVTPLVEISSSHQKTSGGIVVLYPYLFKYGNDGVVTFTDNPGGDWSNSISAAIDGVKIVKGMRTRGGSNAPAGLFWSLNSLIRCTFVGGDPVFQFDTIQDDITVMSSTSIVTYNNLFYWIGVDQFYFYNGVVQKLQNNMSTDWFFNNVNWDQNGKVWGMILPRHNEIWWFYPTGDALECSEVIIYNYQEKIWYDSTIARSAGFPPTFYQYPLMADSSRIVDPNIAVVNTTVNLPNNPISTTIGSAMVTVTVPSTVGIADGDMVTFASIVGPVGGIAAASLNITAAVTVIDATHLSYDALDVATATAVGGGNTPSTMSYQSNRVYPVWTHEKGTDMVLFNQSLAISSYFETNIIAFFDQQPQDDRMMRVRRIEPDFVQTGNMSVIVKSRDFAQGPITQSAPYVFVPGQTTVPLSKIDMTNMGRLISFKFESNVAGGYYQMGKCLLNYAGGDIRP